MNDVSTLDRPAADAASATDSRTGLSVVSIAKSYDKRVGAV